MKFATTIIFTTAISLGAIAYGKVNDSSVMEYESAVVTFEAGKSQLSSEEMKSLNKAVTDAKTKGKIDKIEIAAWSDNDHPVTGDLSKSDQSLAEKRLDSVKRELKRDIGHMKYVHEYNMAQNSNWVGKLLHNSEAELDAVFAKKSSGKLEREDFALIKSNGAAKKAVVILKVRNRN